jgi:transaldolase
MSITTLARVDEKLREIALQAISDQEVSEFPSEPAWAKLRNMGTALWLDTGHLEEARRLWTREYSALTTNNTLANQVVQTGILDDIAREAAREIRIAWPGISEDNLVMELGFVVNCHIALRLVKAFDAMVSVELHPAVAENIERTLAFAERYYAVCPERFLIKIPLTPEGYCAVARARAQGIPINYTLGFSARQNYLAALLSQPSYCNVFLGRLNSVVSDNGWGDGKYVGEKACMATQVTIRDLRKAGHTPTQLIAASMRAASQVRDLAGVDVFTMPPKVAQDFLASCPDSECLTSQVGREFSVKFNSPKTAARMEVLWNIDDRFRDFTKELVRRGGTRLTGEDLREADRDHRIGLFRRYSAEEIADIRRQGKIPDMRRWEEVNVAMDDLMSQSALQAFANDQAALDERLRKLARQAI